MKTIILCIILFLTATASGNIVIDQMTVDLDSAFSAGAVGNVGDGDREIEAAQTLIAGVSGFLSQIDVWVGRQSDATGDIVLRVLNADFYPIRPLAIFSFSADSIQSDSLFEYFMVTVDVRSANIFFDDGDTFAVSLSAPDAPVCERSYWPPFSWSVEAGGQYDEGMRFTREMQDGLSWAESSIADQSVRTWIEPAVAPEPTTIALIMLGLVMVRFKSS